METPDTNSDSLFIFHRDLRLDDNTGLIKACMESRKVYPVFIITPIQVTDKNKFKSQNSIQFMHESLKELLKDSGNKLSIYYGDNAKVIESIIRKSKKKITRVYWNMDYTPYAKKRDIELKKMLDKHGVELILTEDHTLTPLDSIKTDAGNPYTKYTPYKNKAKKVKVHEPVHFTKTMLSKLSKLYVS